MTPQDKLQALSDRLGQLVTELPLVLPTERTGPVFPLHVIVSEPSLAQELIVLVEKKRASVEERIPGMIADGIAREPTLGEEVEVTWTGFQIAVDYHPPMWRGQFIWKKKPAVDNLETFIKSELKQYAQELEADLQRSHGRVEKAIQASATDTKAEEDAVVSMIEGWDDMKRARVYKVLYHQGLRIDNVERMLRKVSKA